MFKPNRIGTPVIHTFDLTENTGPWTPNEKTYDALPGGNVINAVPDGEFGRKELRWAGAAAIPIAASRKICLLHQFTVSTPEEGDAVGVELNASIMGNFELSMIFTPIFMRISAGNTLLASVSPTNGVTYIEKPIQVSAAANGEVYIGAQYRQQVLIRATRETIAGTYAHGFQISDISNTTWDMKYFDMSASVRQLMSQQGVGYMDTLR